MLGKIIKVNISRFFFDFDISFLINLKLKQLAINPINKTKKLNQSDRGIMKWKKIEIKKK